MYGVAAEFSGRLGWFCVRSTHHESYRSVARAKDMGPLATMRYLVAFSFIVMGLDGICCRQISYRALDVVGGWAVAIGSLLLTAGILIGLGAAHEFRRGDQRRFKVLFFLLVGLVATGHLADDQASGPWRWRAPVLMVGSALFLAWRESRLKQPEMEVDSGHRGKLADSCQR